MTPIFTIGHSTRAFEEFVESLKAHGVRCVVDVRRFPASRRHPHFNRDELAAELAKHREWPGFFVFRCTYRIRNQKHIRKS